MEKEKFRAFYQAIQTFINKGNLKELGPHLLGLLGGWLLVMICHLLAVLGLFGSLTPMALFSQQPNVFYPAGFTWSLWLLVFAGIGETIYYRFIYREDPYFTEIYDKLLVGPTLAWMALHVVWLILLCQQLLLWATLPLVAYLVCVILLAFRQADSVMLRQFEVEIGYPLGLHAGWVLVILLIHLSTLMGRFGVSGIGLIGVLWGVIFSLIGLAASYYLYRTYHNKASLIAISWTLLGIALKERRGSSFDHSEPMMSFLAWVFLLLFLAYIGYLELIRYRRRKRRGF